MMNYFEQDLKKAHEFHGHICTGIIFGVRIARIGLNYLGIDDPAQNRDFIVFVEADRCIADAVASVTGCSLGRRRLKWFDYGKMAATFVDMYSNKGIDPHESEKSARRAPGGGPASEPALRLLSPEANRTPEDERKQPQFRPPARSVPRNRTPSGGGPVFRRCGCSPPAQRPSEFRETVGTAQRRKHGPRCSDGTRRPSCLRGGAVARPGNPIRVGERASRSPADAVPPPGTSPHRLR